MTPENTITIKEAWEQVITSDDYDTHMEMVQQAKPLAQGWMDLVTKIPPEDGNLWIAGGGTGQFLDFVDREWLAGTGYKIVLSDVSEELLAKAQQRIEQYGLGNQITTQPHDTMAEKPIEGVTAASLSLVLEHLEDWQTGLYQLTSGAHIKTLYIQIQTYQETSQGVVTQLPELRPSIQEFVDLIRSGQFSPKDIEPEVLEEVLGTRGFTPVYRNELPVPNSKVMTGIVFKRD